MARATLASRELKNKDTGLDLFVPTYKETKGLMSNAVHYQVVLVSNLTCFKAPSHKESDVVQYSIEKKFGEFEDLRNKISEAFSGTVIPPINKKSIIVNELVLRERRNSLDTFLKFLASSKKLSTCQPLLEFLGVDMIRAKKFSKGESLDQNKAPTQPEVEDEEKEEKVPDVDFFGDEEDNTGEELFSEEAAMKKTGEESIFESGGIGVFDGQDLKRELTEEDEADFSFIPDAIISKTVKEKAVLEEKSREVNEDHSDLFEFNEDLDELMKVEISKRKPSKGESGSVTAQATGSQTQLHGSSAESESKRPELPRKPPVASKPSVPSKPKPGAKPSLPKKPGSAKASDATVNDSQKEGGGLGFVEKFDQDDILKYLQDNLESANDDLDLFS